MRSTAIVLGFLAGCTDPTPGSAMVPCDSNFFKGACVYAPTVAATRTGCGEVPDFCDASGDPAPNLSCLSSATAPATSGMVTVTGFVHALTTGPDTNGLSVAFYQAAPLIAGQDIGAATPIAQAASVPLKPETQRACNA